MEIELKRKGLGEEAIAKQLHQARRDLGVRYKNLTPKELKEYIYEVNEGRCGDKLGPTFDYLRNVKKKSYAEIIESAQRPNPDVDKLLGGFKKWLLTKNGL
ncbi:MAG: cell wall-binding protein [Desulfobacteraceae bacterium]|nr:cell wall-binding protein [Desulfobacteraceae bacterium]